MTGELNSRSSKIFFRFLGAVRINHSKQQLVDLVVESFALKNGEIKIKVQDGKVVVTEVCGRIRNEGASSLDGVRLS